MIPKETLGVGEVGFIVCDLEVSEITLCRGYKFDKYALFDFCFGKGPIRFWNSSYFSHQKKYDVAHGKCLSE